MRLHPLSAPRVWRGVVLLLAAVVCAACSRGPTLNPVHGKVLFKGEPLKGSLLTFHPKGGGKDIKAVPITGQSGADGAFALMTGDKEGAPAGEYVVTLICSVPVGPQPKPGEIAMKAPDTEDRFHGAYANRDTSKLRAEVKAGANQLEPIQLK